MKEIDIKIYFANQRFSAFIIALWFCVLANFLKWRNSQYYTHMQCYYISTFKYFSIMNLLNNAVNFF